MLNTALSHGHHMSYSKDLFSRKHGVTCGVETSTFPIDVLLKRGPISVKHDGIMLCIIYMVQSRGIKTKARFRLFTMTSVVT